MVQLIAKTATPKRNKKEMGKNKTPAKSPMTVAMKAKDKMSPKQTPKMKKMAQNVIGTPKQEDKLKSILQTPKSNKKNKKTPLKVKIQEEEQVETLPSTPKSNKKTPKKVKEEIESQEEEQVKTLPSTPKKGKEEIESQEEEETESLPSTPKSNKKKAKLAVKEAKEINTPKRTLNYSFCAHVSGLDFKTQTKDVQDYFAVYGPSNVCLSRNKRNPKHPNGGYGFIFFKEEKDMLNAIQSKNVIDGKPLTIAVSNIKVDKKRKRDADDDSTQSNKIIATSAEKTAFIGRLDPKTSVETISKYFSKYGKVEDVTVMGPAGKSKGFGFITFADHASTQKALAGSHKVDGRDIVCQKKTSPVPVKVQKMENKKELNFERKHEIMVRDLPKMMTRDELKEAFSRFGEVEWVTLPMVSKGDPSAGAKGFGFVAFATPEGLEKALAEARNMTVKGKSVKVFDAKANKVNKDKKDSKKVEQKVEPGNKKNKSEFEVMVRDLSKDVTRDVFVETFTKFGEIEKVTLPFKNYANKGFGFIAFKTSEALEKALAGKITIKGKQVKVFNANKSGAKEVVTESSKKDTELIKQSDDEEQGDEESDDEDEESDDEEQGDEASDDEEQGDEETQEDSDDEDESDDDDE